MIGVRAVEALEGRTVRRLVGAVFAVLLLGCGSAAAPTVGAPKTSSSATPSPVTPAPPSAIASAPGVGEGEPARYVVTIEGRTMQLPNDTTFAARSMPPEDVGTEVDRFERPGTAAIEVLETPWRGETHRQPEFALESGNFTLSNPTAGIIQLVTNFGMWKYVPNGPVESSQFPTHIGELVADQDGFDLVYYMDAQLVGGSMILESVPNLFVSHSSGQHALRIIRVGTIKIRYEDGGSSLSGEIDLIGWARTGDYIGSDLSELAFYRYQATFNGTQN